jgi:hypothetical protein
MAPCYEGSLVLGNLHFVKDADHFMLQGHCRSS